MKSYALAIAMAVIIAAGYAVQNSGDIPVHFLMWQRELPQGIWEVILFASGMIVMWFISLSAFLETRSDCRRKVREREETIRSLEQDKVSLISALGRVRDVLPSSSESSLEQVEDLDLQEFEASGESVSNDVAASDI